MANSHGQSSGNTRGGRASSYDDESRCVHTQDAGGWVRALAVATFDVGTGHTLEQVGRKTRRAEQLPKLFIMQTPSTALEGLRVRLM